ncbi:MAG: class I SAM-dependent methyltransferase [Candidatus Binatia bacterium]
MGVLSSQLTVLLCRQSRALAPEWMWGQGLCEELLRQSLGTNHLHVLESEQPFTVGGALQATQTSNIGIVLDDVSFWGAVGWDTLCDVLGRFPHIGAVGPVSNEAVGTQQKVAPPFLYQTPWLLGLACRERYRLYQGQWQEVPVLDPFTFLVRRADLEKLDPNLFLAEVPTALSQQGRTLAVALDTYVHRYASMYEQPRPDLQRWVPRKARLILDVGCAAGAMGAALKARQFCQVVGIEADPLLIEAATKRLDRVLQTDVEAIAPATFTAEFDCIVCGDVLEHLRDPWSVIAKLATWLRSGGRLVATLPNVGHWAIVADLLQGRWDLVPFGLLCWGHLRFFTRTGIEGLCNKNGLVIERLEGLTEKLPPVGETFIRQAAALMADVDQESLRTSEFLVVARKHNL